MTREEAKRILTGYMGGKIDPESTELYHAIEGELLLQTACYMQNAAKTNSMTILSFNTKKD